ncbi:hypothetical protein CDL12_25271 [Handroanthus impetiginosus]|uniref:Bifunctional inhibitor/plant lipid transfer protein/seed storage helical domain-containing protein n=1 Tax=Handroanthus impetiginosus TaxID=429701 RepID=A0A2G9GAA8_9LAMI|nr:hypothetical protein CDL12_25271 [Handroanthus impetiginosus]
MNTKAAFLAICVVLVLILGEVEVTNAATCNPVQLSPCMSAITSSAKPSTLCCTRLKQQKPCFCQYLRNPNLQKFIKSAGAKKVSSFCRISYPRC